MALRSICAGHDDQFKGHALGAVAAHEEFQIERDLAFRDAGVNFAEDIFKRRIRDRLRIADFLDLLRRLDDAQRAQDRVERAVLDSLDAR